jgi:hypothetical protein
LIPTAQQQVHLLLATDERGQRAPAPRLEPADAGCLTAHLPRLHRLRQSIALVGSERVAIEQPTHQTPRAGRNNNRPRRCRGLQLRRQVRRLPDRNALAYVAAPPLLTDNHYPGGDSHTHPKGDI